MIQIKPTTEGSYLYCHSGVWISAFLEYSHHYPSLPISLRPEGETEHGLEDCMEFQELILRGNFCWEYRGPSLGNNLGQSFYSPGAGLRQARDRAGGFRSPWYFQLLERPCNGCLFFVCLSPCPHPFLFLVLLAVEFFLPKEEPQHRAPVGHIQLCHPLPTSCHRSQHMIQGWPIRLHHAPSHRDWFSDGCVTGAQPSVFPVTFLPELSEKTCLFVWGC